MKKVFVISFFLYLFSSIYATHNRAGYIVYEHVEGYKYKFYIWTFTYTLSPADRDSLPVWWGDSTMNYVHRVQYWYLPDYYKKNLYIGYHTFPGPGTYEIVVEDPNRNEGIINIPNSVNTVFAIKTILRIDPFLGHNNSIKLSNYPLDKAALEQTFIYNPGAYDLDGDSLSFKIDTCRYNRGEKIPWFSLPQYSDTLFVNPQIGDFVWQTPQIIGKYNVAIRIEEWRNGSKIGFVIQDMQIEVVETDNHSPEIEPLTDICVEAGDTIDFDVIATDVDNDSLALWASGLPFLLSNSPAQFYNEMYTDTIRGQDTVIGHFRWITNCEHVRSQPYIITFKVKDDNPFINLIDNQTIRIKVVPPGVKLLSIEPSNATILLKWNKSRCENCKGYKIYRSRSFDLHDTTHCQTGINPAWNYELIATVNNINDTIFVDDNNGEGLQLGFSYCYRVVPYFNDIDGYASNALCSELIEGMPIMLKVSVSNTDQNNGAIQVQWHPPINLDTTLIPPPYRYYLYYSRDLYGSLYQGPYIFDGLEENTFIDTNINTVDNPSIYKLELVNFDPITQDWQAVGHASIASSPFIELYGTDRRIDINIKENVPWLIERHVIYRFNPQTSQFDSIGQTNDNNYSDYNVINGNSYTYKVKSIGSYSSDSLPRPLINWSQEASATAIDTVAPCCPIVDIRSDCENEKNIILWHLPTDSCLIDIANFKIYYKYNIDSAYNLIANLNPNDTMLVHIPEQTLAACYLVQSIDSAGNESNCQEICIDICEYYKLPNTFTPNGDGINDVFRPYPYKFVEKIDMKIYNRWGDLVYHTTDPDINWMGKDQRTGKPLPEGVYYYLCDVYEKRLTGIVVRNISGFINLYRKTKPQIH